MGLLDLFSKDKRDERSRAKNIERALHKHVQSGDRFRALEALVSDGGDEALFGLLRRFGFVYDKTIEDEQEKEYVFDSLVAKGKAVIPATQRYLNAADSITWPLRLLSKVASAEEELSALKATLARHEPGYERDPSKKIQLMNHLARMKHPEAPGLVVPYLKDMDEGVRFAAVEALLALNNEEAAREALLTLFASDTEESRRIRLRICDGFAQLGWAIETAARPGVQRKIPETFIINQAGRIAPRSPSP